MKSPTLPPPSPNASGIETVRRANVVRATVAEFQGKPFAFGKVDCMRLFRAHAVRMGHRKLAAIPRYRTLKQAKAVLKGMGADDLEQLLDGLSGLTRIPPSRVWQGDVVLLPGELDGEDDDCIGTIGIVGGGNKVLAWHPDCPVLAVAEVAPDAVKAAWRL